MLLGSLSFVHWSSVNVHSPTLNVKLKFGSLTKAPTVFLNNVLLSAVSLSYTHFNCTLFTNVESNITLLGKSASPPSNSASIPSITNSKEAGLLQLVTPTSHPELAELPK